ncbi:hypothetical protein CFRS1_v012301 [Colletotrichum fructicola]|nr:hypothetical protein CFRS1_v012301 [Colletotrichum fructicola]
MFHDQQHRSTNKLNYSQAPNQQAATTGSAENCTRAVFPVAPAVSTLPPTLTLLRVTTRQRISTFGHQKFGPSIRKRIEAICATVTR